MFSTIRPGTSRSNSAKVAPKPAEEQNLIKTDTHDMAASGTEAKGIKQADGPAMPKTSESQLPTEGQKTKLGTAQKLLQKIMQFFSIGTTSTETSGPKISQENSAPTKNINKKNRQRNQLCSDTSAYKLSKAII